MSTLLDAALREHPLTRGMPPILLSPSEGCLEVRSGVVRFAIDAAEWYQPVTAERAATLAEAVAEGILRECTWMQA